MPADQKALPRAIFDHWTRATRAIGVAQTRLIMLVIYVAIVLPTGLVFRLVRDPLHLRRPTDTNWLPSKTEPRTIERIRQQF